jgi:ATP synthase protein I
MASDAEGPNGRSSEKSTKKSAQDFGAQSALALELPFTLVGAVVVGGLIGYFLDKWLHTSPWLLFVFGAIGFFGGVREVLRRMPGGASGK